MANDSYGVAWQAARISRFIRVGEKVSEAGVPTEVWLTHDKTNLYVAFKCHEPEPEKIARRITGRDGTVFLDDCVELFLDPGQTQSDYFHIAVNSIGTVYDSGNRQGPVWNGEFQVAAKILADSWIVEMAIPYSTLGVACPTAGQRWNINAARERKGPPAENSAWAYLPFGGFNQPVRFETIEFKKD